MFYPNRLVGKKLTFKKYKYASFSNGLNVDYDENLTPIKYSKNTYNFDYTSGALTSGMGVKEPEFFYYNNGGVVSKKPDIQNRLNYIGAWYYNYYRESNSDPERYVPILIVYTKTGNLMYMQLHSTNKAFGLISGLHLSSMPQIMNYKLNGKNVILISTPNEGMYSWHLMDGLTKYENAPVITSMCVHYERLFVTTDGEQTQVWFSDDLDPTNFNTTPTEGGFIELKDERGRSNKVLTFDDYVYVVRDYGFSKISAYGSQDTFSVFNLFVSSGRIFANTCVVCGDKIVYLATDGIYAFDGVSTSRLDYSVCDMIDPHFNENAKAVFSNGAYYLHCNLIYPDSDTGVDNVNIDKVNNTLIKLDLSTGEMTILRTYDICNIASIDDIYYPYVLACVYHHDYHCYTVGEVVNSGKLFDIPTHKVWSSPMTDFGYMDTYKYIKHVTLYTKTDITLRVYYDDNEKDVFVHGSEKSQTIKLNIKAKRFRMDFISDEADVKVSNPEVLVGV